MHWARQTRPYPAMTNRAECSRASSRAAAPISVDLYHFVHGTVLYSISHPAQQYFTSKVTQINLAFPCNTHRTLPMFLMHIRNLSTAALDQLMARDPVHGRRLDRYIVILHRNIMRGGFDRIYGPPQRELFENGSGIVRQLTQLAP